MCKGKITKRNGVALIVCMVFLAIFTALAVGMVGMADTNARLARNQHTASLAFTGAQSGLEVMRYYLLKPPIEVPATSATKMETVYNIVQHRLNDAGVTFTPVYDSVHKTITIPIVTLDGQTGQGFGAVISQVDPNRWQAEITGSCGPAKKLVVVDFNFVTLGSTVFDFGIATKGPLSLSGQADVGSTDLAIYADVYIEGFNVIGDQLTMSNKTSIAGDVSIANPSGTYSVTGEASVGGATGSNIADHVEIGAPEVDFPVPNPKHFLQYATGPEITGGSNAGGTYTNCIIRAGSTVTFAGDTVINGVLYIESPSNVTFSGKTTINGIIAGDGVVSDYDGISHLTFAGQVESFDISVLTDPQFAPLQKETGTFICAPGFTLDFTGQDLHMSGAVAGNGISFSGQSGGIINGSIIDYSKDGMTMVGQSSLTFNRSGRNSIPAGFEPDQRLDFMPQSYSEPAPGI